MQRTDALRPPLMRGNTASSSRVGHDPCTTTKGPPGPAEFEFADASRYIQTPTPVGSLVTIEEAIVRLEDSLRRLKVQYEMFFAGSLKRQPFDLRREVEQLINTHSNSAILNYAHRFQFNTLVSRYNALHQLWIKQLRAREEGTRVPGVSHLAPRAETPGARPAPQPPPKAGERTLYTVRISDPANETESMRLLYEQYLEAKGSAEGARPLKLESFIRQVTKQASDLLQSTGSGSIEFRVLRNGDSVSLKVRAAAQEPK